MHLLGALFAATTTFFSVESESPAKHLLEQLGSHEKTVTMIDHQISKAEYQEKNPQPNAIFESPIPTQWFAHTCGQECADSFMQLVPKIHKLHAASAQNRFHVVCNLLKEHPELAQFLDDEGNTILHHTSAAKHANLTVAILCLCPELITVKNKQNQTPIDLVIKGNPKKVRLFVRAAYATK